MKKQLAKDGAAIAGAVITWFGLILQFVLMMQQSVVSLPETVIRFLSYFTILTNILVAVFFTSVAVKKGKWSAFFAKTSTATAVLLYIAVVGIIYNTILRGLREIHGADLLADTILHTAVPLYMLLYWIIFVSPGGLKPAAALPWLWYPLLYCIYVLARGSASGFYPYFFLNTATLGYAKALLNCLYVTTTFLILALLLIGFSNWLAKMEKRK